MSKNKTKQNKSINQCIYGTCENIKIPGRNVCEFHQDIYDKHVEKQSKESARCAHVGEPGLYEQKCLKRKEKDKEARIL